MFEERVREIDVKFEKEQRKVSFIVNNCPAHPETGGLKSVQICFLSPNTLSSL